MTKSRDQLLDTLRNIDASDEDFVEALSNCKIKKNKHYTGGSTSVQETRVGDDGRDIIEWSSKPNKISYSEGDPLSKEDINSVYLQMLKRGDQGKINALEKFFTDPKKLKVFNQTNANSYVIDSLLMEMKSQPDVSDLLLKFCKDKKIELPLEAQKQIARSDPYNLLNKIPKPQADAAMIAIESIKSHPSDEKNPTPELEKIVLIDFKKKLEKVASDYKVANTGRVKGMFHGKASDKSGELQKAIAQAKTLAELKKVIIDNIDAERGGLNKNSANSLNAHLLHAIATDVGGVLQLGLGLTKPILIPILTLMNKGEMADAAAKLKETLSKATPVIQPATLRRNSNSE